jgi:hypothetical protein
VRFCVAHNRCIAVLVPWYAINLNTVFCVTPVREIAVGKTIATVVLRVFLRHMHSCEQ